MASVTVSITVTSRVDAYEFLANGNFLLRFSMLNADGSVRTSHRWTVKADGSAVTDEFGATIATPPAGLITALANLQTNTNNALTSAAGAGKITI